MQKILRLLVVLVTLIAFAGAPMAAIAADTGDKPPAADKAKKDDKTKKDDKAKKPEKKPIKPPDEGC